MFLARVPALDALVELPAGRYTLGEPGEEREVELARVLIGRYPVVQRAHRAAPSATIRSSPTTPPPTSRATEAEAFCASIGARLPTADEWEALARGARRPRLSLGRDVRRDALQLRRGAHGLDRPGHRAPARRVAVRRRAARRQRLGVGGRPHARRLGRRQGRLVPRHRLGAAGGAHPARRPRPRHPHHRLPHRHRPGRSA